MRREKNVNLGIARRYNDKFFKLALQELFGRQWGELLLRSGSEMDKQSVQQSHLVSHGFHVCGSRTIEWKFHIFLL